MFFAIGEKLKNASALETASVSYKKMSGTKEPYYRIRIGEWRIGIYYKNPNIVFLLILQRGQIYKKFPPKN
ncbi:MAG: hypothetical protein QM610_14275 [Chitinophagaceae bacterium]